MPQFLEWPIKTRADWEALKERYQPGDFRYPRSWPELVERYRQRTNVLRVGSGAGYLGGFYGRLRGLLGFERLSLTYYDDPKLLHEMNAYHVDFLTRVLDRCFSEVDVDVVVIGEDMAGRNGSLISPAMFREFMLPYYRQLTGFLRDHRVGSIWVDSDGDIRELIPLWIEADVTGLGPIDNVAGLVDVREIREAFPKLLLAGGLDKRVVEEGRTTEEVDAELERKVPPMLRRGGYFPGPDHGWTPRASLRNYQHFYSRLRELCGRA
jgi:uroporphyrinogen decarboxylase